MSHAEIGKVLGKNQTAKAGIANQGNMGVRSERDSKKRLLVVGRNLQRERHTADKKWDIAD